MSEQIPPPPWQRPRKPPPRTPLSQERVVRTALDLLDAEGLDALSMRRLAQELNTGHASLYAHVGSRDELLDLIYDEVLTEVDIPDPEPGRWAEQVKEMLHSLRKMFQSHRDMARIAVTRIPLGGNGILGMERTLTLMRAGGLPDDIAAYAGDLLSTFVIAECMSDPAPAAPSEGPAEEAAMSGFAMRLRGYLESLPAERFPTLVALAGPMTSLSGDRRFELGLDIMITGLLAYVPDAGRDPGA